MTTANRSGRMIPLAALRTDGGTQQRVKLSDDHVRELAEVLLAGGKLPPVVAFFDGDAFWLADGFHTLKAHENAQREKMLVEVREGTQRDAILFSVGANAEHGLKRNKSDLKKAIGVLLADSEWSQRSTAWIADAAGTTRYHVDKAREEANGQDVNLHPGRTNKDIPQDVNLHPGSNNEDIPIDEPIRHSGRDGKSYPANKKRPADASETSAEPTPTPQPEANGRETKSGQPAYDDRIITDLIGKLTRAINDRAKARGQSPAFQLVWDALESALKAWKNWQKENEKGSLKP